MEKSRVQFETHLENQRHAYHDASHRPSALSNGIGFAHAVVGAVALLIKANPLNPLSFLK